MNLIKDKWIPVRRKDGTTCDIAPWEIGQSSNPVIEIRAPRPDFRGALYQFLIGLVQTAFAPGDSDEWKDLWDEPPSSEELRRAFERFSDAFELLNENGPAFMQDYSMRAEGDLIPARQLLIEVAGNPEHFVKHDRLDRVCERCAATALYVLQTNAPEGGRGHRTSMRGGGPLNTIVLCGDRNHPLWHNVWLNILSCEESFDHLPHDPSADVFPWMAPTRSSRNDVRTYPNEVNELQMYWELPRRIRLQGGESTGTCSVCGTHVNEIAGFAMETYGVAYGETWQHALSPYRSRQNKDGTTTWFSIKGKNGRFTYQDWLALTLCNDSKEKAARVVRSVVSTKAFLDIGTEGFVVSACGYDMKQMKARCWYSRTVPLVHLPPDKKEQFIETARLLIAAADKAARVLIDQIKAAWFERPRDAKGDTSFILASFWEETEAPFYSVADRLRAAIVAEVPTSSILKEWRSIIIAAAEDLFDRFALQETDTAKNMKRIAGAAKALSNILRSPKTKSIEVLREVV